MMSNPCSINPGGTCGTNIFTIGAGTSSTGLPAATANGTSVGPFTGGGDCNGQFSFTRPPPGGVLTINGGSSNEILAVYEVPTLGCPSGGTWRCPTSTGRNNSVLLPECG